MNKIITIPLYLKYNKKVSCRQILIHILLSKVENKRDLFKQKNTFDILQKESSD